MPLHAAGDLLVGEAVVDVAGHVPVKLLESVLVRTTSSFERRGLGQPSSGRSTCTQRVSLSRAIQHRTKTSFGNLRLFLRTMIGLLFIKTAATAPLLRELLCVLASGRQAPVRHSDRRMLSLEVCTSFTRILCRASS